MNKILIIGAHPDDEILGVGGTILKHVKAGDQVKILILGDGETARETGDIAKRQNQAQTAAMALGVKDLILEKLPDNQFDSMPLLEVVKKIEKVISEFKPEIVYTHHGNDLNIDHQLTFQAVITACRPQPEFFVKKILTFETLSSTEWQNKTSDKIFLPNEYQDISEFIDKKIEILKNYQYELRLYPHPRSAEGIKILAQYRGLEVGFKYAEAFCLIRNIIN